MRSEEILLLVKQFVRKTELLKTYQWLNLYFLLRLNMTKCSKLDLVRIKDKLLISKGMNGLPECTINYLAVMH